MQSHSRKRALEVETESTPCQIPISTCAQYPYKLMKRYILGEGEIVSALAEGMMVDEIALPAKAVFKHQKRIGRDLDTLLWKNLFDEIIFSKCGGIVCIIKRISCSAMSCVFVSTPNKKTIHKYYLFELSKIMEYLDRDDLVSTFDLH